MEDRDQASAGPDFGEQPRRGGAGDRPHRQHRGSVAPWSKQLRLWILRALALLAAFVLFAVVLTGAAGWYTSRPQFCNSCHIMEPYYTSWEHSSHADVTCVKCHFPPGVGEKVRGKLLGLVQLAKYVTRTEGPRPAAEIPDASCLRSGCHETRLLSGRVDFQGIPFDHAPHLGQLQRGMELRCTSCHSQIVQGAHMTVTATTCYLCHFKSGFFNQGLGACTRCHQIPEKEFDLGGGVTFNHDLAYEKGVECASCHADLIRGKGEVPVERCTVCHNREDDLRRIDEFEFIHRTHVSEHNVDCLSCHLTIHHTLDPHKVANAAADCLSCHPDHHRTQVELLTGTGGRSVPAHLLGSMANVRIACPTCHVVRDVSPSGAVLMKATLQTCTTCHDASEVTDLESYNREIRDLLPQLASELERIRAALDASELPATRKSELAQTLSDLEYDVRFLAVGNDIHNSHYANVLLSTVRQQSQRIAEELEVEPPDVQLPERPSRLGGAAGDGETEAEVASESKPGGTPVLEAESPEAMAEPPSEPNAEEAPPSEDMPETTEPEQAEPDAPAAEAPAPEDGEAAPTAPSGESPPAEAASQETPSTEALPAEQPLRLPSAATP